MGPVTFARRCIEHQDKPYCNFAKMLIATEKKTQHSGLSSWAAAKMLNRDEYGFLCYLSKQVEYGPAKSTDDYNDEIEQIYSTARSHQRTCDLIDGKKVDV